MNIPPNTKPFSLELAKQNHPLITRDGRNAKFIAYVPDANKGFNLVVMIDGNVYTTRDDGQFTNRNFDVFLAPLGMCEGLPVFAGDTLHGVKGNHTSTFEQ